MHFPQQTDPPPLEEDSQGVIRVKGTRIPLERVIDAFRAGDTPEQIAQDYDTLSIQQVYAVVNFYLQRREEVDAYLGAAVEDAAALREDIEKQFDPVGIRARLFHRNA
ncbi:MAG: DUF433 domain-containing protein [Planctomycetes bacterium]|nr:DUF433 domain-containing protein [Planctomycetota bacterium]